MARLPPLPFFAKTQLHAFRSEIENKTRACQNATKLYGLTQCVIWNVHGKNQPIIIFLMRVSIRFSFSQKRSHTRTVGNSKLMEGLSKLYETLGNL